VDIAYKALTVQCAWHPKYFGESLVMREGSAPTPISHGICPKCLKIALCSNCTGDYENPDATSYPSAEDLDAVAEEQRIREETK
jgi:hypothetical protein